MTITVKSVIFCTILFATIFFGFLSRDKLWTLIGGNADQGQIAFEALRLPDTPNHFLACPRTLCINATPNSVADVYSVKAERLRDQAIKAWSQEANLELVDRTTDTLQIRYVQRTPLMRFPDTVSVRFVLLDNNSSTLAFYSRSLIGYSDFGANNARYQRWINLLSELVVSE